MRRETGASESADPAPPATVGPAEPSTRPTDDADADGDAVRNDDRDPVNVDAPSSASGDAADESDQAHAGVNTPAASMGSGDPGPFVEKGTPAGAVTTFEGIGDRGDAAVASGDGPTRLRGTGAPGVDAGRGTSPQAAIPTHLDSNADPSTSTATSGQGLVTATAAASATNGVRTTSDRRLTAGIASGGSTPAATSTTTSTPTSMVDGAKAIPDGMRGVDPAVVNDLGPRSKGSATEEKPTRPRGASAVVRAAEMNTELRNARAEGDASQGSRPGQSQGSTGFAAAGSMSVAAASSGPASPGPEAQSLPNGPASVAPMEAGAESGRTVAGVARGLQALSSQRGGTLVMRLDPGNLGQVRMEMSLDAGRVQVVIAAAGDAARGLLRENLGVLRHALEDRGFAVERLTVESTARTTADSSGPRGDSRGDGQDARGGQGSSDRQDASDERSRGRRDDATHRRSERGRSDSDRFDEVLAGSGGTSSE